MKYRDPDLAEAARICARWAGRRVGDAVPCRSTLIGRELVLRVGGPAEPAEVVACAVPRSEKKSKRCRPAYLVKRGGLFPRVDLVDGGKVRNASRTPRASHGAPAWQTVGGVLAWGPRDAVRENTDAGEPAMLGLDLPYPHRVGSHVCCPDHAFNALVLGARVRDEYEGEGELSAATRRALAGLAGHLRTRHAAEDLPAKVGAEDFEEAFRIVATGDGYCAKVLGDWQTSHDEAAPIRREEQRKLRNRRKGRARSKAQAAKSEQSRAVKALQRITRGRK